MKKFFLLLLLTSFLLAKIDVTKSPVKLNSSFELNNTAQSFDTTLRYTHKKLLSCTPQLSAVYKIVSASTLKVIPTKPLHSSTNYSCSYEGNHFTFQTEPLKLLSADFFKEEKIVRLSFNDNLQPKSIHKGIKIEKVDKLAKTTLNYTLLQSDGKNLLLKINEKFKDAPLKLTLSQELLTSHGVAYPKTYVQTFNTKKRTLLLNANKDAMNILDEPRMVALPNGAFALRIFVSDNLAKNAKDAIVIEGVEHFRVSDYHYLTHTLKERYNIKDAYYYHDIYSNEFKPNSSYKVTLKAGLSSYYQELKEDLHYTLKTDNRAKSILFDEKKPYISNNGELAFTSINIDKATLIVERILDENLRYFVNFSKAKQEEVEHYTKELFSKEILLNLEKNRAVKQKFKLSDLSPNKLAVGIYKVTIRYEEPIGEEIKERWVSKVLFLSNLGITAKIGAKQAFVSVFSLDKAQPISGVQVEVYGKNNELLGAAKSNRDGIATLNKEMLKPLAKGIIVKKGDDQNFLALNNSINSPSIKQLLAKPERFKAHIYFQSQIVRPKAKIHALITIKDRDFISASNLPVKVVLKRLYAESLIEQVYHTDNYGLIDFSYQLDNHDKRGDYQLAVYMGEKLIGQKSIKVEAFVPPKIENHMQTNKEIYNIDELIELNISSSYLFGAAASNLEGSVTINAQPINYHNPAFKNYSFSNEALAKSNINSYIERSEEIVLDENGEFKMLIKNSLTQKVPSILEAMLGVTIMDDAQAISSYKKVKIYPYRAMVGVKINSHSLQKGQKLEGRAILIDPHSGKLITRQLSALLKRIEWHYEYVDGAYNWEKETTVVDRFTLNANEPFSREIMQNGNYILEVHDRLEGHSATVTFDVFGWNYTSLSPQDDLASLEIQFEDKLYQKGDMLEVKIKSPILEGQLLLTLEGEEVQNYKLLPLHKGVAKASLKITQEMKRGLQLHALAIRATDTPSMLIPFRAMGYRFVKPNREHHKIAVELKLPKTTKSKQALKIKLKTSKASKVLISVVDSAILQLVEQKEPKIFDYFNEEPPKKMSYHDLYDQLLSHIAKGEVVDFGAGDMLSKKQRHVAPDLGKRIEPFMVWSGIFESSGKELDINVDIPEFNGRASVVAIAINGESIGVASKEIEVKDDIMIKASYPLYGLVGDSIQVPIRLFNTTSTSKELNLSLSTSDNLNLSLKRKKVKIPANSSKLIQAKLLTKNIGKGAITLYANYDNQQVSHRVELPIFSPYALSTKTFKGIAQKKEQFITPKAYQGAKATISLTDNYLGALRADLNYLVSYPYGCAEQTASKLLALHYAQIFLKNDTLLKEAQHFIKQGIKKLHMMQNYYGEFEYWEEGGEVNPYASLYVAQTLLEIDRANRLLKTSLKNKIVKMLNAVALNSGAYQATYSPFHQLYAAYILAENNLLSITTANMLYEKKAYEKEYLASYYMAAILKATGKERKAQKLFDETDAKLSKYNYTIQGNQRGNFESSVRDSLLFFTIKTKYAYTSPSDFNAIQNRFNQLNSTQERAIALKAVSTYLGHPKPSKLHATVSVNGKHLTYSKPKLLTVDKLSSSKITLEPHNMPVAYSIELSKHLPKKIKNQLSNQKTLSIRREFIDANGVKVELKNLYQGQKLFSKVTLLNFGKIDNVVVNQRVPACLSIVNNNISRQRARFKDENVELQYREIGDERVLHFINLADKKVHNKVLKRDISVENISTIYTPLIATSIGECHLPAVTTEAMYDSRISDYAKESHTILVKKRSQVKQKKKHAKKERDLEQQ